MNKVDTDNEEAVRFAEMDVEYEKARAEAIEAETMYFAQKAIVDTATKAMKEAKAAMVTLDAKGIEFMECEIDHRKRAGAYDMKALQRDLKLNDDDLNKWRKPEVDMVYIVKKK